MNNLYKNIQDITGSLFKELVDIRRYLHKHPEPGREEFHTSEFLRKKIKETGYFKITMVGKTGFVADLVQNKKYPWLALRADMDALPIKDEKEVDYKSMNENFCHACGHDFHSTVVLGVSKVLYKIKDKFKGNIRFIFQHAEEPIPGGALDFINQDMLNNINCIFGLHADPSLEVNSIGLLPGWISAQSIHWKIIINGRGGHSSRPQNAIDPIFIGVMYLNELYSGLYRKMESNYPFVFTVGKLSAGDSYNSIPNSFEAEGTLRITNTKNGDELLSFMANKLNALSENWGASAKLDYIKGSPPVNNDNEKTELIRNYLKEILHDRQFIDMERSMGGEDFGYYQTKIPGVFLKIGVKKGKKVVPVHSGKFDINENAIPFAVSIISYMLVRYFNELKVYN